MQGGNGLVGFVWSVADQPKFGHCWKWEVADIDLGSIYVFLLGVFV